VIVLLSGMGKKSPVGHVAQHGEIHGLGIIF
jgi:hypothetical protein